MEHIQINKNSYLKKNLLEKVNKTTQIRITVGVLSSGFKSDATLNMQIISKMH